MFTACYNVKERTNSYLKCQVNLSQAVDEVVKLTTILSDIADNNWFQVEDVDKDRNWWSNWGK